MAWQVGEHLDINLPGFYTDSPDEVAFGFDTVSTQMDAFFPNTLPERNPEFEKLGCYSDVLTSRAVGGGTW